MYIVRWLMTHPIIAIWVLGGIAILLSRGGADKGAHEINETAVSHQLETSTKATNTDHEVNALALETAKIKVAKSVAENVSDTTTKGNSHDDGDNATIHEKLANKTAVETNAALDTENAGMEKQLAVAVTQNPETNVETSPETNNGTVIAPTDHSSAVVNEVKETLDKKINKIEEAEVEVEVEAEPVAVVIAQVQSEKQVSNEADSSNLAQSSDAIEILIMAREAYWNEGFDESAELYMQLIKLEPNNINYKGELANVYWKQGYPKKAAELYSEIALPMIENGNSGSVANMVGFIGLFYPDRAAKIHQKLMSITTDSN